MRIGPVFFESWQLLWDEKIWLLTICPLDKVGSVLGCASHSPIHTVVGDQDDMGPGHDGIHVLEAVNGGKGRTNHIQKFLV